MSITKPSLPKGTRDFSPQEMVKRNYIFDTIKTVFKKYGYAEIQTPSMENLQTLTGKYGDEGDKLIFKILNSGNYLSDLDFRYKLGEEWIKFNAETALYLLKKFEDSSGFMPENLDERQFLNTVKNIPRYLEKLSSTLAKNISEKALRYDLTVPFARYVVMHQSEISFPFKRFQVQPVWRADRPQKGRYREFYQCDADVVGSPSLLNEAEFILIYHEALSKLGLKDFNIKINNRKILYGIAETIGQTDKFMEMTIALDKLDKIGNIGVTDELIKTGFSELEAVEVLSFLIADQTGFTIGKKLDNLRLIFGTRSKIGLKGIEEIEKVFDYVSKLTSDNSELATTIELDITLARGLNYYTGCIFEVKTNEVTMGSIGGGGRYDDLTGMFGLKDLTGVGISFGADRIYDVLEELNLFPASAAQGTKVLISNFDEAAELYALPILQQLRTANISAELYPSSAKLKKQMSYAHDKNIPYVILIGGDEMESGLLTLKDMQSGEQQKLGIKTIIGQLGKGL
ncbi:histidine--tRNA ligase [Pedobacter frigiditerrae]|uniref:Histidine--tRNA ligase n=1 Tax=Pedobacter frigiditerrae TaxID=2530452 RepID=A0A4R0N1B4_9SPHI|nr:histidine--tRNA ligase [Pedobacter frigiditerrae]TCC93490.1 histidine--tRNA ligase [Pedobacter frigiditerrae]